MKTTTYLIGSLSGAIFAGAIVAAVAAATGDPAPSLESRLRIDRTPPASATDPLAGYADIVEKVAPSVVSIHAARKVDPIEFSGLEGGPDLFGPRSPWRRFFEDRGMDNPFGGPGFGRPRAVPPGRQPAPHRQEGMGSGVILTEDGYILTNNHVVAQADEITVLLGGDETEYSARVIGTDAQSDLAVLKIDAAGLSAATLGDSDALRPGHAVLAIGNPFGLTQTVTSGIVSATGRNNLRISGYEDFIQTDASINPGNSGGALIDNRGRVIGINTAIYSRSGGNVGIGFAIPVNMAVRIADSLVENGEVRRGYLGVMLGPLTSDLASALGVEKDGVLVNEVLPDSPAAEAGLEGGDVIVSLDEVEVDDINRLRLMVGDIHPGAEARFTVVRDGREMQVPVTIGRLEDAAGPARPAGSGSAAPRSSPSTHELVPGLTVAPATELHRQRYGLPADAEGLVAVEVEADSQASEAGLREGDLIVEAGRKEVRTLADAREAAARANDGYLLLRVKTASGHRFVAVKTS